ncbi:MAG: L-proline amide hydrolase [Pseudonocardiales bacterium]|jgi:L-proline amide hydrolase|nr:L-proline amide hydrolase [Pseudonocardiales bacterium]
MHTDDLSGLRPGSSTVEGEVEFPVVFQGVQEVHRTWYRIVGDLHGTPGPAPLITLHGGPGATHDYLLSMSDLAVGGRAIIFYDQIGNGRSSHLPDRGADFWTVGLFVQELQNLVRALDLGPGHHVLGQSWGGFLAQEYALTQPEGLRSLILADTAASFPDFVAECNRLRTLLPAEVDATLRRHEEAGTTESAEYAEACQVFYRRHVCRLDEWPAEVDAAFGWIDRDPTVYHTMNGPSEFHVVGSIRDWQSKDRLSEIAVPTLLVSGAYDEAAPALQQALLAGIEGSRWTLFEQSSHMPHVEERARYMQVVGDWLTAQD